MSFQFCISLRSVYNYKWNEKNTFKLAFYNHSLIGLKNSAFPNKVRLPEQFLVLYAPRISFKNRIILSEFSLDILNRELNKSIGPEPDTLNPSENE